MSKMGEEMTGGITYEHVTYFLTILVSIATLGGIVWAVASRSTKELRTDHEKLADKTDRIHNELQAFQLNVAQTYTPMSMVSGLRSEMNEHFSQLRDDIASLRDVLLKGKARG